MSGRIRLVLAGAGHTHVEVLRRLGQDGGAELRRAIDLVVVSSPRRHLYSGMVPGYLGGRYRRREITVDAAMLTRGAGGRFVDARVAGLDPRRRQLRLDGGARLGWDLVSVAVGSSAAGGALPGVAEHAARVAPIAAAVDLRRRLAELSNRTGGRPGCHALVVGGGAAGVEVAFAARAVLGPSGGRVTLAEGGERILEGYGRRLVRLAGRALAERDVAVRTGCAVDAIDAGGARLADGGRIDADLVVWATGAAARPWLADSGLPVDRRGFLLVDRALRSTGDARVFAAGDCAVLAEVPDLPRAGVYAVREAPVLWRSLCAAVLGGRPPSFEPQRRFLSLLNTGDGRALLSWRGLAAHSRCAWWLKDRIDRRYVRRYQRLY